jgi:translation initiation factor eIF-2B subunit epsilon
MPPKEKSSSSFNVNEDKILQAVVIADSFNERFMPITIDKPRVILIIMLFFYFQF